MERIAVIDVETTGFADADRIVEVGVVYLDGRTLDVIDEYETLINPLRDISASEIHGVTATMVENAPTFSDIAAYLATTLNGAVIAAHNLPFDGRFLRRECENALVELDLGQGIDTLRLTGERLPMACQRFGIANDYEHWALADARATAELIRRLEPDIETIASRAVVSSPGIPRSLPRENPSRVGGAHFTTRLPSSVPAELAYLDVLDRFLADAVLDDEERAALADLGGSLGIRGEQQYELHVEYLNAVIAGAERDQVITVNENAHIRALAATLGIDESIVPEVTESVRPNDLDGLRVCFTGSAVVDGVALERKELEALAAVKGLQPVGSVTKKACDLLVAADPASTSGKAKKARDYGIPVMGIEEFLAQVDG